MKKLPTTEKIMELRKEAKRSKAIEAYKFFYPTVSMISNFEALENLGARANNGFLIQLTTPDINALTQNSDTPYGLGYGDVTDGPVVLELVPGPIMGVIDDANFKYITDIGLTGEEQGKGAKYLFVSVDYTDDIPEGYIVRRLASNRFLICLRAVVKGTDTKEAFDFLRKVKAYPLKEKDAPQANTFQDFSHKKAIATPYFVDGEFSYWKELKKALDLDAIDKEYYQMYGLLAELGIEKEKTFEPDEEMKQLLTEAAVAADEQMVINAFASDVPERIVWESKNWEWVVYGGDSGYYLDNYLSLSVRERWFYQATLETPKMFMRREGSGSIYCLGIRDKEGRFLDGEKTYTLKVPVPVPANLYWSVTGYDLDTRSEIVCDGKIPVISSLKKDFEPDADSNITLFFGPNAPSDVALPWIQTVPGHDWFVYFRIYGPSQAAFNGHWQLEDFERVDQNNN
ncbi:DUF1254 domain-containing protein [Listeria monocytogenes]|uniref:DUF1214 domain-containing protein n=1 Tax=Listeria monocytogenes TaxID=1639 RepID=UPI0010CE11C3|nr:DUF1254 domain-containing protein [Listeria monocytogenes]EAC8165614.1 DUF1254 domain-containing protein [Listeria monocytogenes]EAG2509679.1 DUF1254 domain-containing protein [Listeria monocytogenes]EAW7088218.1 DUF1254 domain-containing protein [Listeria monocytogenes]EAW7214673.1 DUF1254 domain-containing protein [Listeria monocytogenes]ECJ9736894.1 DUF1254 domain-containing protein [Listeria monocytogenes]